MKRLILVLFAALALALVIPLAGSAQDRKPPATSGASGGGGGQVAAPRGGGSSNSGGGGGGQVAAPRGGNSGGGSSSGGSSGGGTRATAPQPRGSGGGGVYGGGVYARERVPASGARVYPQSAVPRSNFPSRVIIPPRYYGVSPWYYYSPYAYGLFGLGYWGWDPYWWGGWYGPGYWGYPYGYGGYGGYGGYYYDQGPRHGNYYERDYGSLKLKVKPKEAQVYVDGYYMGQVNDFDGAFQHLDLEAGTHKIEIRAEGYQPLSLEMKIEPGRTVNYKGELRRR